jgi:hypothetical protein
MRWPANDDKPSREFANHGGTLQKQKERNDSPLFLSSYSQLHEYLELFPLSTRRSVRVTHIGVVTHVGVFVLVSISLSMRVRIAVL